MVDELAKHFGPAGEIRRRRRCSLKVREYAKLYRAMLGDGYSVQLKTTPVASLFELEIGEFLLPNRVRKQCVLDLLKKQLGPSLCCSLGGVLNRLGT